MTARAKSALPVTRRPDGSKIMGPRDEHVDLRPATIDISRFMEDRSWPPGRPEDYLKAMNTMLAQTVLSTQSMERIQQGMPKMPASDFLQFSTISVGLMQPDNTELIQLVMMEKERRKTLGESVEIDTSEPVSFSLGCL